MGIEIRDYTPQDLEAILRIHRENGIDYRLPDLDKFPVNKVMAVDGTIRAAHGLQLALEGHLWLSTEAWTDAEGKWAAVKALDKEATAEAARLGVESIFCCIPPGYERFGRRIKDLGYYPIRRDWVVHNKETK